MLVNTLSQLFNLSKESSLFGRYITIEMIRPLLNKFENHIEIKEIGTSVENRSIHSIKIGKGKTKVLLWSQMHGNESTTTKAIFDLLNGFNAKEPFLNDILESCTLVFIPILNPDGAERYTRVNANEVDLNRDATERSQPESVILRDVFNEFVPDYCFNLHGQRTIFGAGASGKPATLSFLAPSMDVEKSIPLHRKKAMSVIRSIFTSLKEELNDSIGLFDDGFNINCVGDTFQSLGASTLLFEAGHYPNDYNREETRYYIFKALVLALKKIASGVSGEDFEGYFAIPSNKVCFYDVIIKNAKIHNEDIAPVDIAIQFKEVLKENNVDFIPQIAKIGNLDGFFGHKVIEANSNLVLDENSLPLKEECEIVFVMLNYRKILLKS